MTRKGERKSVDHTLRHGIRSMLRSVARRDDFDVPDLTTLHTLAVDLDAATVAAVDNLRRQGHSWAVIGKALGVTRQEAHRRYALPALAASLAEVAEAAYSIVVEVGP